MRFGEKIRRLRTQNGLTQEQLADMLGVTKRTIIGYERDGRHPKREIYNRLAEIFDVPVDYLYSSRSAFTNDPSITDRDAKEDAQQLMLELTEMFANGCLSTQDMDGIIYEMNKAYFKYREEQKEKDRILTEKI